MKIFESLNLFILIFIIALLLPRNVYSATGLKIWEATDIKSCSGYCYIVGEFVPNTSHDGFVTINTIIGDHYEWRLKNIVGTGTFFSPVFSVVGGTRGTELIDPYPYPIAGSVTYSFIATTTTSQLTVQASCTSTICTLENAEVWDIDAIAPTPPPSVVSKTILIPGMGASWNVDALVNCKKPGDTSDWSMAPYAKDVYDQILASLSTDNWDVTTFNYDWRNNITSNAAILTDVINSKLSTDEKVNIVGHSMGGLIGRNYLETNSGGKAAKLFTVGTPHQGAAIAYPAVVGGQVWANDMVERIAATLLFKHCGISKSFKNLLPTYNYLRDDKTKQLIDVGSMKTKNNYLPTNFVSDFWGVKVGTLAGTGYPTLKIIDVTKNNKWPDGKPVGRENVNDGDGTVLVDSAQIPGAFSNDMITGSHSEIIGKTEGVNKILAFLGLPGVNDPPYSDPTSALILVGYPGSFSVTDSGGFTTQSENGIIALMNPKDGNYQLQIVSTSPSTTFIVGQFLPNNQNLYKEYKFEGLSQEPRIISFNLNGTSNDVVHGVGQYQNPHFPKFWFEFWKYWNKFHK